MIIARLLTGHSEECLYIKRPDQNEQYWFLNTYDGLKHIYRDKSGGNRGRTYRWVEFICPDNHCTARGLVRADSIEAAIKQVIESK
jgi:hypothetical protein